jgi:CelD/BcsL family acetyltransferase involved in cellulose biosynthesis
MHIDRIDNLADFERLRASWDVAYSADPNAQVFVSWNWLRAWFEISASDWFVLAARDQTTGEYFGFLPLATHPIRVSKIEVMRELRMGGKPFGPITGFIADPKYEAAAIAAIAEYVDEELGWERLRLEEVLDPRVDRFLTRFSKKGFEVDLGEPLSCPYLPLPSSWDEYLAKFLSKKGRYNLKRGFAQVEALQGFRITSPSCDTIADEVETLMSLWQARWGQAPESTLEQYRHMYRAAFAHHGLWLRTLWEGDTPIASLAAYVDPVKRSMAYYTSGFDRRYEKLSPGKVVVGYAIRDAIEDGFDTFDFLVGGHDYKLSFFGASERFASSPVVTRQSLRKTVGHLLVRARDTLKREHVA